MHISFSFRCSTVLRTHFSRSTYEGDNNKCYCITHSTDMLEFIQLWGGGGGVVIVTGRQLGSQELECRRGPRFFRLR